MLFLRVGGVLRAQHRGRSIQHEYKEFVGNAMMSQKATVLELFNLTLGWGPQSDRFWEGTYILHNIFSHAAQFCLLLEFVANKNNWRLVN